MSSLRSTTTPLTPAERDALTADCLARASQADDRAERHALVEEAVVLNVPVADSIARRYRGRGMQLEDLIQVARLSLVIAAHRYEPGRDTAFLSYAVPVITGSLRKHFRDHGWSIRPARRVQEAHLRIRSATAELTQELGRAPSETELAEAAEVDVETLVEARQAAEGYHNLSLDHQLTHEDEDTLAGTLGCLESGYNQAEARAMLRPLVMRLRERDQLVIRLRYVEGLTQREVGERIGVSQMQVSRILSRILDELRAELTSGASSAA